ncbi:MAG: glycosyltransferase [Bdellovibrionaceae bacterium]|nr:glycosyltransferase [Pseudobdellovibrionaceae bacterium]
MVLVSVIIPVFDRIEPLERALRSVQKQTFQDFEIIVVDDHSTVDIFSVTEKYATQYLKSVGKGVSAARNRGIQSSRSEWIAFLDSDDEWLPNKLELQFQYLSANKNCDFVHSNELWIRNGHPVTQSLRQRKMGGRIFSQCTERCLIAPSSVLARKSLLSEVGLFDESFPVCEDFDLWLQVSSVIDIGFIQEPLVIKYGGHSDQLSMQFHSMDLWRVRALVKHLKNINLTGDERVALGSSLKKKCEILLKGFHKHGNFENRDEIQSYLETVQLSTGC